MDSHEFNKVRKLAKKLKALAERGEPEEAKNAEQRLVELLKKHNIKRETLFGNEIIRHFNMTTLNEGSVLLGDIITSVAPDAKINIETYKTRVLIKVALSDIDYMEVKQKYAFFWKAYNEERKLFLLAFKNKHYEYFMPEKKNNMEDFYTTEGRPIVNKSDSHNSKPPPSNQQSNQQQKSSAGPNQRPQDILGSDDISRMIRMKESLKTLRYVKTRRMLDEDYGD